MPLAAISVGLGGAWIAQLRELERFFYVFVAVAAAAFAFAFYRLYLRPQPCAAETACLPSSRRGPRIAFWTTLAAAKALVAAPFVYAYLAA